MTTKHLDEETCGIRVVHVNRVNRARDEIIGDNELDRLAQTYKILGDPTRLKIVMALGGGEMCVCDLAAFLDITESAVSHQLRRLRDMSLINNRREGQMLFYSLDDDHVEDLLSVGLKHVREG